MRHQEQDTRNEQRADEAGQADQPGGVNEVGATDQTGRVDRPRPDRTAPDRAGEPDATEFHEPAPLPTTFGAPTVGGAVAASVLASGNRTDELDARDERTVGARDGATEDQSPGTGPGGSVAPAGASGGGTRPDRATSAPRGDGAATTAAEVAGPASGPLLDPSTARRLREHWRDVQLRFVDDPRGALDEARGLVGEAVDSLTASLREQRERLDQGLHGRSGGGSDGGQRGGSDGGSDSGQRGGSDGADTERIRVAIRRYRDFLDRLVER